MSRPISFNGKTIFVPDDATDDEVASILESSDTSAKPVQSERRGPEWAEEQRRRDPTAEFLARTGAEVLGGTTSMMRGGTNIVGKLFGIDELGQKIWPTAGMNKDSLPYLAGSMLDPVSYATGTKAFDIAGKLPMVLNAGRAAPVLQGTIGGAAAGAATGAISETGDAASGAVLGGAVGGGLPLGIIGAQKLGQIARPLLSKAGAQESAGRMANEVVGPAGYRDARTAMLAARGPYEAPTVGQTTVQLRNPELAALQKISEGIEPNVTIQTSDAQRAARENLLKSFSGSKEEVKAAREALKAQQKIDALKLSEASASSRVARETSQMPPIPREEVVNPMLAQAGKGGVVKYPGDIEVKATPGLEALKQNTGMQAAIADAKKLAENQRGLTGSDLTTAQIDDITSDPTKSFEGLKLIKAAIDDRFAAGIGVGDTSLAKIDDRTLTKLKKSFLGVAESAAPGWNEALKQWGQKSNEIFQKEVGRNMLGKLQKPLGEGETPSALARAIEQEASLVKKSGGFGRTGLDEQLTQANSEKVAKVVGQLDIDTQLNDLAKLGMKSEKLSNLIGPAVELPNLMNQGVAITNSLIKRVYGAGKIKTIREMATLMQDPAAMAQMMQKANVREQNAVAFLKNSMKYVVPQLAAKAGEIK